MSNQPEICTTGVWVDTQSGEVVTSEPEEGTQLVPKGSEITPDMRRAVELAGGSLDAPAPEKDDADGVETATADEDVETASDDLTVTTKSTTRKGRS